MSLEGVKRVCAPIMGALNSVTQKCGMQNTVVNTAAVFFWLFYDTKVFLGIMGAYWYPKLNEKYNLNTQISTFASGVAQKYLGASDSASVRLGDRRDRQTHVD